MGCDPSHRRERVSVPPLKRPEYSQSEDLEVKLGDEELVDKDAGV